MTPRSIAKRVLSSIGLLEPARKARNAIRSRPYGKAALRSENQRLTEVLEQRAQEVETLKQRLLQHEDPAAAFVGRETTLPGILFNAVPKSAGVFLTKTLAQSLDIEFRLKNMAHGYFPNISVIPHELERLRLGNVIRHEHIAAPPRNVEILSCYIDRLVLHLRDPRQATLSWMHHANRLAREHSDGVNYTVHALPVGYLDWPLEEQLDWQIETHLVSLVEWLEGWRTCLDDPDCGIDILVTSYEEFRAGEDAFFRRITEFYGIPTDHFAHQPAAKTIEHNFRKGEPDEWKLVFSASQKKRCVEIIGDDILERFGWER